MGTLQIGFCYYWRFVISKSPFYSVLTSWAKAMHVICSKINLPIIRSDLTETNCAVGAKARHTAPQKVNITIAFAVVVCVLRKRRALTITDIFSVGAVDDRKIISSRLEK